MGWMVSARRMAVSPEVLLLLLICLLDAVSSAYLFQQRLSVEANPLLRPFAEAGPLPLIGVKMAWSTLALAVVEAYGRQRPRFVLPLLRYAIAAYLLIYVLLVGRQFWGG